MKITWLFWISLILITSGCCGGEEVGRERLSDENRAIMPYQTNIVSRFRHSDGYEFDLNITVESRFVDPSDADCSDYIAREDLTTKVTSVLPQIELTLKINNGYSNFDEAVLQVYSRRAPFERVDTTVFSQTVNGITYNDLIRYTSFDSLSTQQEILISADSGIIQLTYFNGDTVQLIN